MRINPIYSKENLAPIVNSSLTISEVLEKLNLRKAGGNFSVIKKYIKKYELNISHFDVHNKKIHGLVLRNTRKISLSLILVENSTYGRTSLKRRLYDEGLKSRNCEKCGQGEEWQGKKMSLILDHKNGIYNDNRIENLQIVCPNCNATLDTHCGKNK
jgi:hypothetical protein